MYLKSVEMVGFKSFADKTILEFEPGMTAIVGPNGCGKSNVADAVRWVLGEQSAKALRGTKMEDVIFSGTDYRKPLGMAEVSITFVGCEQALQIEYDEVTITRRVFRSGEGQYFINKTPCRLKDIQRMFMDTGIGTASYSLMEQGRIDRILSSRPEDRREIFEEASGITKYKSDKKEALRKLDQTEANLLRLADVIREVKRQIGSLQRQAGKARRYKEIRDHLRTLDIYITRERLKTADTDISKTALDIAALTSQNTTLHEEIRSLENDTASMRESLALTEREMAAKQEACSQAKSNLRHAQEMIAMNRQRIAEYQAISDRDSREIHDSNQILEERKRTLAESVSVLETAKKQYDVSQTELSEFTAQFEEHKKLVDSARNCIQNMREEAVELEGLASRLHNELMDLEAREKSAFLQRERLAAEQTQLTKSSKEFEERRGEIENELTNLKTSCDATKNNLAQLASQRASFEQEIHELQERISSTASEVAAGETRIQMLSEEAESAEDIPSGTKKILQDTPNLGLLADHITVEQDYQKAFEAAFRPWLDSLVVENSVAAVNAIIGLAQTTGGSARILSASAPSNNIDTSDPGLLVNHVKMSDQVRPSILALIGHVRVVKESDLSAQEMPDGSAFVTKNGLFSDSRGLYEHWSTGSTAYNPVSRKHLASAAQTQLDSLTAQKDTLLCAAADIRKKMDETRRETEAIQPTLDKQNWDLAQKQGELIHINKEAEDTRNKLETVGWELKNIDSQSESSISRKKSLADDIAKTNERRTALAANISSQNTDLRAMENRHSELNSELTEKRLAAGSAAQRIESLNLQYDSLKARVTELESLIKGRTEGIESYGKMSLNLEQEINKANERIGINEKAFEENNTVLSTLQLNRNRQAEELTSIESNLVSKRKILEEVQECKSKLDVQIAENKIKRQNLIDRICSEYNVTIENIVTSEDPVWEGATPALDAVESEATELRTKLEAMGEVNHAAVEEFKELEDRYTFLITQEQDLTNAKQQLMDMIRKINKITSEMFRSTFEQVNSNFDLMFKKLFNGGTARLVLVNEEDILDCGIEIIARPPGKRLQNVSLLSGGERTMTAVALLFAIYMIKPSPFCLLDELDAALDEANIGRFVQVLKGFINQSQFVVITHNRQTIAAAGTLYGVTMPEKGISKIISMRFREYENSDLEKASQPVLN